MQKFSKSGERRVGELQALQKNLEGLDSARKQKEDAGWQGLVKVYEAMKPKDAANILSTLDLTVQLGVLGRMKESKVAPILSAMDIQQAKLVTDAMAARRAAKAEGQTN